MRVFDLGFTKELSDDAQIARLKEKSCIIDLKDQEFLLCISKAAVVRCEVDLLKDTLLAACQRDTMQALLDFARTAERPARYGYLEVLRKAGLSYPINQARLNPKIVAYVQLVALAEEKNFSTPEEKKKFLARFEKIRGLCNGWSFLEYSLTAQNIGASHDLWMEAAKFELFAWDGKQESLSEVLDLPQSAPMTRGELFERIIGMILAYQGDYCLGGDEPVTQAALRGDAKEGFGGVELSLQGRVKFLNQTVECFTTFSPKGLERLLKHARFVEVIENGVLTFAANNHIIYLAAYKNGQGELCYQLFDSNCSAGRLSTKRLSLVAAQIPGMLRADAATALELNGFVPGSVKAEAVKTVTLETAAALRSCTAVKNFTSKSLVSAVRQHPSEWFLSMLPCFRDVYKQVVNTIISVANSYGGADDMSILAALVVWNKAELVPVFLRELQADANLKTDYKGQTAIFYALNAKSVAAVADLLAATSQENIRLALEWQLPEHAEWIFTVLLPRLEERWVMPMQGFDDEDTEQGCYHPNVLSLVEALRASKVEEFSSDPRLSKYPSGDTVRRFGL